MSLLDTLITLKAKEFDVLRGLFPPIEGSTVNLLQRDGTTNPFKLTPDSSEITTGWYIETNKYQQTRELKYATSTPLFYELLMKSGFVAIGSTIFAINKASAMPPSEKYPHYTLAIEANGETYDP